MKIKHSYIPYIVIIISQIGENRVGKSALINNYKGKSEFEQKNEVNIIEESSPFIMKDIKIGDVTACTHVWEVDSLVMSDKSRESEAKILFRSIDCLIIVADLTSVSSVANLNHHYNYAKSLMGNRSDLVPIAVVGNKIDLYDSTMIPVIDGLHRWMKSVQTTTEDKLTTSRLNSTNLIYFESSAKMSLNCKEVFHRLIRMSVQKHLSEDVRSIESKQTFLTPIRTNDLDDIMVIYKHFLSIITILFPQEFSNLNPLSSKKKKGKLLSLSAASSPVVTHDSSAASSPTHSTSTSCIPFSSPIVALAPCNMDNGMVYSGM